MSGPREFVSAPRPRESGPVPTLGRRARAAAFVALTGVAQLVLLRAGLAEAGALASVVGGSVLLAGVALHAVARAASGSSGGGSGPHSTQEPDALALLGNEPDRELWRIRATVDDTPGSLASLTEQLSRIDADVRTMQVHPVSAAAVDELLVHLPAGTGHAELVEAVTRAGAERVTAERTDPHELDDVPTRALRLGNDLVEGTAEPARALRALLGEVTLRRSRSPEAGADTEELDGCSMRLAHPSGGVLTLHRATGEFTPAEFSRARSMLRLAGSCAHRLGGPVRELVAKDGSRLTLRPADRSDLALVRALHDRCSGACRHRRYFAAGFPTEQRLELLLSPELGRSTVALSERGEVVAMGNLGYEGDDGELALLVRDDWHGLGLGSALRDELIGHAGDLGLRTVSALTQLDNTVMARTLRSAGFKHTGVGEPGEWSWVREVTPENARTARPARSPASPGRTPAGAGSH